MGDISVEPKPGSVSAEAGSPPSLPLPSQERREGGESAFRRILQIIKNNSNLLKDRPIPSLVESLLARVQAKRQVEPQKPSRAVDVVNFRRNMTEGKKIGLPEKLKLFAGLFMEKFERRGESPRIQTAMGIMNNPIPLPLRV